MADPPIVTRLDGSVSDFFLVKVLNNGQMMVGEHFRIVNGVNRTTLARP